MSFAGLRVAIIAGGASRRMGADKAGLVLAGETLLARTVRLAAVHDPRPLVVGRAAPLEWNGPPCSFIPDSLPGAGPLGGITDVLVAAADASAVLALPCDLPGLTPAALEWLEARWRTHGRSHGTVALRDGRPEPLFAVYDVRIAPLLTAALAAGERACWRALAPADLDRVELPAEHRAALTDCDTPAEWSALGAPPPEHR